MSIVGTGDSASDDKVLLQWKKQQLSMDYALNELAPVSNERGVIESSLKRITRCKREANPSVPSSRDVCTIWLLSERQVEQVTGTP